MRNESFHLTALDVRRYDFGTALRGYDKARVDQFRGQVADELDRLTRRALELEEKAKGFHEQLRAFRERDKALNDALVSAQQLRGDMRDQAERDAALVVRAAQLEAERILDAARNDVRRLEDEIAALAKARRAYLAQLRLLIERQLADVVAAESTSPPAARAAAGDVPSLPAPSHGWLDAAVPE